ncbi:hypothetical protein PV325_008002 [Microctonus aethiopoides]|nr:hypothetical protein PV325_008002 [Microctonus aethiopoides]
MPFCVFCNKKNNVLTSFTARILEKANYILSVRKKHKLKYDDVIQLSTELNDDYRYHVKCYYTLNIDPPLESPEDCSQLCKLENTNVEKNAESQIECLEGSSSNNTEEICSKDDGEDKSIAKLESIHKDAYDSAAKKESVADNTIQRNECFRSHLEEKLLKHYSKKITMVIMNNSKRRNLPDPLNATERSEKYIDAFIDLSDSNKNFEDIFQIIQNYVWYMYGFEKLHDIKVTRVCAFNEIFCFDGFTGKFPTVPKNIDGAILSPCQTELL